MPLDSPKHPSTYPIWMRQAIEAALATPGQAVFAVAPNDGVHEQRLRRRFRAYVKALHLYPKWGWIQEWQDRFVRHRFTLVRNGEWLELIARPCEPVELEACELLGAIVDGQATSKSGK